MNIHECIYKTQTLQLFTSQKNKLQHVDRSIQKVFRRGEDYINHTFWPTNWTSVPSSTDAVRCTSAHRYCITQGTENFLLRIHFQKSCVAKSEAVRLRNDITKQYNSMHFMGFEVKVCAVMVVRPNITQTSVLTDIKHVQIMTEETPVAQPVLPRLWAGRYGVRFLANAWPTCTRTVMYEILSSPHILPDRR